MSKDNPGEFNSEWLEEEKFKEFLREYVEKDAYNPKQDDKLRVFVTYKTLYRIYTATLNTKTNVQKLDKDLAKLNETADDIEKGLDTFRKIMAEQEKINKAMLLEVRIFFILIIVLGLVLIYNAYEIFK